MDAIADWLCRSDYPNILSVFVVAWLALLTGLINWGFSLIFCGMLAARINERFRQKEAQDREATFNYPLVAACAYLGMLVWHGGLSGSAPLMAHQQIPLEKTLFSSENLFANGTMFALPVFILFCVVPFFHGKHFSPPPPIEPTEPAPPASEQWHDWLFAGVCTVSVAFLVLLAAFIGVWSPNAIDAVGLTVIVLLALGLLLATNASNYQENLRGATTDFVPILVQFPFYAGIVGVAAMDNNQIVRDASGWMVDAESFFSGNMPAWFPVIVDAKQAFLVRLFFQACIVKFFVPSGAMHWELQGQVTLDENVNNNLGVEPAKIVLAIAYGHQVGNMLQPFWVLPIVSLTRLRVADILAFSAFCAIPAAAVFLGCLLWI